jgi:hypothetical protein
MLGRSPLLCVGLSKHGLPSATVGVIGFDWLRLEQRPKGDRNTILPGPHTHKSRSHAQRARCACCMELLQRRQTVSGPNSCVDTAVGDVMTSRNPATKPGGGGMHHNVLLGRPHWASVALSFEFLLDSTPKSERVAGGSMS